MKQGACELVKLSTFLSTPVKKLTVNFLVNFCQLFFAKCMKSLKIQRKNFVNFQVETVELTNPPLGGVNCQLFAPTDPFGGIFLTPVCGLRIRISGARTREIFR